ncbi:hypothetical protein VIGAN_UM157800, partial [Vigna angularis var. angularis]
EHCNGTINEGTTFTPYSIQKILTSVQKGPHVFLFLIPHSPLQFVLSNTPTRPRKKAFTSKASRHSSSHVWSSVQQFGKRCTIQHVGEKGVQLEAITYTSHIHNYFWKPKAAATSIQQQRE